MAIKELKGNKARKLDEVVKAIIHQMHEEFDTCLPFHLVVHPTEDSPLGGMAIIGNAPPEMLYAAVELVHENDDGSISAAINEHIEDAKKQLNS